MTPSEVLRAMPKVELHLHLEGSVAPDTINTIADRNGLPPPLAGQPFGAAVPHYTDFRAFADRLLSVVRCFCRLRDFSDAVFALGERLASSNIQYAEVTWTPQFYLSRPDVLPSILDALNDGRRRARESWGVEMAWIPDLVRSYPQPMDLVTRWAISDRARENGVVALGLGGPEEGVPSEPFAAAFRLAQEAGLPVNPHAGENGGPGSVRFALDTLGARRIGHGVRAVEDDELVATLAADAVPLEVCLTSNIALGVYANFAGHPVKALVEAGCVVTLNTDDPALFGTSLEQEYGIAMTQCGLGLKTVFRLAMNAVRSSYLDDGAKSVMEKQFQAAYDTLRARVAET